MTRAGLLLCVAAAAAPAHAATRVPPARVVALPPNHHPIVSLALQFRAGAVDDPPGKAGLTALTAQVMAQGGTQSLDSKQLLNALFPMAATLRARVDKELTTFSTTVHQDHVERMRTLLTDVVAHPRWDEKEFARIKADTLNFVSKQLRQSGDEELGKEALGELLFAGHPNGRLTEGHLADLAALTLADVRAHAARVFTRDRLTIGVAGGYAPSLPAQLDRALAALPATGAPAVVVPPTAPPTARHARLIDKPGAATAVSMGLTYALSRTDPDFAAMNVARSAFGEHRQFNGRLMSRLREARGLNYGDYAYIEHFVQEGREASQAQTGRVRHAQTFTIWLRPVQNENALFAVRAALYELDRSLHDEPFSDAEVAATKGFLDGYLLLFAQTDERKLGYALDDAWLGTPDSLAARRRQLAQVTAAQVNAAWRKWIDPARLQIVLVTDHAADVQKILTTDAPTPMHYPKDAQGHVQPKPPALLATDARVEKFPFGLAPAAVEVVPVTKLFE